MLLLLLWLLPLTLTSSLLLSGYNSYSLYPFYSTNRTLSLEFSTTAESGLLLYTQDGEDVYFLELKLSLGQLVLRYDLSSGMKLLTIGSKLNDGLWHRAEVSIGKSVIVTLDGFVSVGGSGVGGWGGFGGVVFVGGLPPDFIDKLDAVTLPSAVFEPRWAGGVRRVSYGGIHVLPTGGEAHLDPLPPCPFPPPCIHGTCIPTLSGPHCDCTTTKYTGHYCNELKPEELARFDGHSFISYNSSRIMSSVDEIELEWKTNTDTSTSTTSSTLFYAGDGRDYMSLHLRGGKLWLSINLGSGPLEVEIEGGGGGLGDGLWHSIKIIRRVQEMSKSTSLCHITSLLDGQYNNRWTLAGNFKILSSTFVSVGGRGSPTTSSSTTDDSNFSGCMKNVHFTADSLKLNLIELSRSRSRLVGTSGQLGTECQQDTKSHPRTTLTFTTPSSALEVPLLPTVRNVTLSLRTTEADGLILSTHNNSTMSLELIAGQLYLNVGGLKVLASQDPITDGEWHAVSIMRNWRGGRVVVDKTVTDWNGEDEDWGDGMSLGGGARGGGSIIWTKGLNKGFVGCLGGLSLGGVSVDLGVLASQQDIGSIRSSCTPGNGGSCISSPCLNNGRCSEGWNRYICDCRGTEWTGGTCARLAPKLSLDGTQGINLKHNVQLQALDLSIRFRTNRASGDLISLENGLTSLRLSLTLTRLKLTYNLSTSERSIITGSDLNDNLYHLVRVSTRGNVFQMQVDDWPIVSDQVLSRDFRLNITVIRLGSFSSRQPYAGTLSQVHLNGQDLLAGGDEELESSFLIRNNTNYNSVSISEYISLEQLRGYRENRIEFNFKTSRGGLLLFNAGALDWISIEIHLGKVWFSYNDGGGVREIWAGESVADGRWHSVKAQRGGSKGDSLTCDGKTIKSTATPNNGTLDLNGVLYIGGVPSSMYKTLSFRSVTGFVGCLASLELGGEAVDPIQDSLKTAHGVTRGCNETESCTLTSCSNSAPCVQSWPGPSCDCEMSSYAGPTCSAPSTSYKFNRAGGLVLYNYEIPLSTRDDRIAFGITTKSKSGTLIHSKSIDTPDYLKVEMADTRLLVSYNTGGGSVELLHPQVLSDGAYHVVQIFRLGSNMTISIKGDAVNSNPSGSHHTVLHDQSQIEIGGILKSGKISQPFRGTLSGLTINGIYMLDLAAERDNKIRLIGDVVQVREADDGIWVPDDRAMQKTPPSNPPLDDLVSSAGPPCSPQMSGSVDDEDSTCLYPDGAGSGDELITPIYVPSSPPSPPSIQTMVTQYHGGPPHIQPRGGLECDDEDCNIEGSGVLTSTQFSPPSSSVTTTNSNSNNIIVVSTNPYSPYVPPSHISSTPLNPPSTPPQFHPYIPPSLISLTLPPDDHPITPPPLHHPTRPPFTPPTTPPYIHSPTFRIFDWPEATSKPPLTKPSDPRNSFVAEAGDSTLVIIIIIALLMIIIVSILIIFFMCKRKEEGVYKVEDKGRYEFVGGAAGAGRAAGAQQAGRKGGGVKEWYV